MGSQSEGHTESRFLSVLSSDLDPAWGQGGSCLPPEKETEAGADSPRVATSLRKWVGRLGRQAPAHSHLLLASPQVKNTASQGSREGSEGALSSDRPLLSPLFRGARGRAGPGGVGSAGSGLRSGSLLRHPGTSAVTTSNLSLPPSRLSSSSDVSGTLAVCRALTGPENTLLGTRLALGVHRRWGGGRGNSHGAPASWLQSRIQTVGPQMGQVL